jgi:hypothetical protein
LWLLRQIPEPADIDTYTPPDNFGTRKSGRKRRLRHFTRLSLLIGHEVRQMLARSNGG